MRRSFELFNEWRTTLPGWSDTLCVPPHEYSREAGWELTPEGNRRNLYFKECYRLVNAESDSPASFQAASQHHKKCPWCSSNLRILFKVDLLSYGLATNRELRCPVQVLTCEVCTAYGTVCSSMHNNGDVIWSPNNVRPEYLPEQEETVTWDRLPQDCLRVAEKRSPFHAADLFIPTTFFPAWWPPHLGTTVRLPGV